MTFRPATATPSVESASEQEKMGAFRRAADAVLTWEMHRGSGLVVAVEGPATEGRTVVLELGRPGTDT